MNRSDSFSAFVEFPPGEYDNSRFVLEGVLTSVPPTFGVRGVQGEYILQAGDFPTLSRSRDTSCW